MMGREVSAASFDVVRVGINRALEMEWPRLDF